MYCSSNVGGTCGRRVNRPGSCGCPSTGRNCNYVYNCLLDLLEDALDDCGSSNCGCGSSGCGCGCGCSDGRNCNYVYECLEDLIEDASDGCGCNRCC